MKRCFCVKLISGFFVGIDYKYFAIGGDEYNVYSPSHDDLYQLAEHDFCEHFIDFYHHRIGQLGIILEN